MHRVGDLLVGDDVAGTPDLEVPLLLEVDDDGEGVIGAKHLGEDIAERVLQDLDHGVLVDVLELLELGECLDEARCFFFLCHWAIWGLFILVN